MTTDEIRVTQAVLDGLAQTARAENNESLLLGSLQALALFEIAAQLGIANEPKIRLANQHLLTPVSIAGVAVVSCSCGWVSERFPEGNRQMFVDVMKEHGRMIA